MFFHKDKYFEKIDNNIEKLELSFNEAFDDLFYPLQPIIGRNKNNLHDKLEFKIAENKTIKFLEYCTAMFENKVNIINNNFICEDREKINKINDYANKILEETKNPLRKIDNSSKKILIFLNYKSTNIQDCIRDIKILTDYFRLITNNYILSPNIVYLTDKDSKEEFCMLYDTEIKQYRYTSPLNNRIRIFSKNLNSFDTISKFFENYDILETCIFVLNENNYSPRFSNLYLSRTIDCIGNIAKYELEKLGLSENEIYRKKYKKIIELYFREYPEIINKIILKDIKYKEEKNDNLDDIRGKKITAIRAQLVHFDINKNRDFPDVLQIQKLTRIFELLICVFIFKQIGVEENLIKEIFKLLTSESMVNSVISQTKDHLPAEIKKCCQHIEDIWNLLLTVEKRKIILQIVNRINVYIDKVEIEIKTKGLENVISEALYIKKKILNFSIVVPTTTLKARSSTKIILSKNETYEIGDSKYFNPLIQKIAIAVSWKELLDSGKYSNLVEFAKIKNLDYSTVCKIYHLNYLAPDIVEYIANHQECCQNVSFRKLCRMKLPLLWQEQRDYLFPMLKGQLN